MKVSVVLLLTLCAVLTFPSVISAPAEGDGSRCTNISCSPPLPGAQCTARYERDDGCCPVWYCNQNGATSTIYGKSTGGSSSSFSSSSSSFGNPGSSSFQSSSSSFGNGGGFGGMPSFGGFQIQLPNFGNLFG